MKKLSKKFNLPALGLSLCLLLIFVVAASIDYRALNPLQFTTANTVSLIDGVRMTNAVIWAGLDVNGDVLVTGDLETQSDLDVGGASTFVGDVAMQGALNVTGIMTGIGSGITQLDASDLSSGTVPTARLGSGTANSTTILYGDNTWGAAPSGFSINTNNLMFARCDLQVATSQVTNFVFDVTNNYGRFMQHNITITAAADVMLHPVCSTNAVLALEVTASGGTRRISFPTNFAQLSTAGLTLQSTGGTNWYTDILQNCIFVASIKTNEALGRLVMVWKTNAW